ncbi:MAG: hypothetical protein Sapg2KO_37240 [Saprospiraceae bacterium]
MLVFKKSIYLIFACCLLSFVASGSKYELDEEVIKSRIDSLESEVVSPRYDNIVKSYLRTYTIRGRDKSERILGRRLIYFPIFEQYIKKYNLPDDLKYLPIVESALEPRAVSVVGAGGLWQFMPETGRYYGLEINSQVDERCDPHYSTDAAMQYLSALYNRFNDWELAIAAYNSGGGRVSRAMKRARSKNFWRVKRYLPRETANYVPAFIAATYLLKHYEAHDLEPRVPSLDAQIIETTQLNRSMSFYEIAQISGAALDIIELLNPAYSNSYIPVRPGKSRNLTLPKRNMIPFVAFLEAGHSDAEKRAAIATAPVFISQPSSKIIKAYEAESYLLKAGDSLQLFAAQHQVPLVQLQAWNNLNQLVFEEDQEINIYVGQPLGNNPMNLELKPIEPIRTASLLKEQLPLRQHREESIYEKELDRFLFQNEFLFYWTPKRERLSAIANKLPGVSLDDLLALNDLKKDKVIKSDEKLKIKKLSF